MLEFVRERHQYVEEDFVVERMSSGTRHIETASISRERLAHASPNYPCRSPNNHTIHKQIEQTRESSECVAKDSTATTARLHIPNTDISSACEWLRDEDAIQSSWRTFSHNIHIGFVVSLRRSSNHQTFFVSRHFCKKKSQRVKIDFDFSFHHQFSSLLFLFVCLQPKMICEREFISLSLFCLFRFVNKQQTQIFSRFFCFFQSTPFLSFLSKTTARILSQIDICLLLHQLLRILMNATAKVEQHFIVLH